MTADGLKRPTRQRKTSIRRSRFHRDADQLDLREREFVRYYLIHGGDAKRAATAAGYTGDCAKRGWQLLQRPEVRAVLDRETAKRLQKLDITSDRVLMGVARVAFADLRDLIGPDGQFLKPRQWHRDIAAAVSSFETSKYDNRITKVRMADRVAALELLGSYLGLWAGAGRPDTDRLDEVIAALRGEPKKETIQ